MSLQYYKSEKVSLRSCGFDEKWLQQRIEDDVTIIGLGDLNIIERERKQSSGGKLDFLLNDPEGGTMYELEIQLGSTDESHIMRTIEYWDIESRRFPSKDHKAVIIAEEITNRFFNVIALMNRSIPIIAIQLNAIKIEDKILLNFTKVLDTYESPQDEEFLAGEAVDRTYWANKSHPKSMQIMDTLMAITGKLCNTPRITYNKHHVALGTQRKNYAWFRPRKREGYCHFTIAVGNNNVDTTKEMLEESGISYTISKGHIFAISIKVTDYRDNKEMIEKLFNGACELAH